MEFNMEILQSLGALPMLILIFFIFYFILIRPQVKEQKEKELMLEKLSKNHRVLTRGGLIGKIQDFQGKNKEYVVLDNEAGSKIKILKNHISSIIE